MKNVIVGAVLGGLVGFVIVYLSQILFLDDRTILNLKIDTGTHRPPHQFWAFYITVKYINLVAGISAGSIVGSIAGAVVSINQNFEMYRRQ